MRCLQMSSVKDVIAQDAFAGHMGMELLSLEPGYARARMKIQDFHRNSFKMVHGGAIFSLADFVFQAASNSHGVLAVAIQANIAFLQAPRAEFLYAEATEISCTRRLATYAIRVTEEDDKQVALFQGTVYRMPEKAQETTQ